MLLLAASPSSQSTLHRHRMWGSPATKARMAGIGRAMLMSSLAVLAAAMALGLPAALADGKSPAIPAGRVIYERTTRTARWLEVRDLRGGSPYPLTPPPAPGELRR